MQKKRWAVLLLLIGVFSLVAAGCGGTEEPAASTSEPVKIGVIIPLSGPAADSGQQMRNGYLTALKEIEENGWILGGREIELIFEDGKGDPSTSVAALEKLVTRDNTEIILGTISSTVDVALAEPMKRYEPIFGCTGGASFSVEEAFGDAKWFFHYHPWEYDNVRSLGEALIEIGGPGKLVVAHEDGIFGTTNINMIEEILVPQGFELVKVLSFKSGSADLSPVLTQAKNTEHDYFIWIGYPADATTIATQMKEINYSPKLTVGYTPGWPEGFGDLPEGEYMTALGMWSPSIPTPLSQKFVEDYTDVVGEPPQTYWAAMAYVSLVTMADAIDKAGSTDKEAVIAALEAGSWETPLGTLKFHQSRISPHAGFDYQVLMQWQKGIQEVIAPKDLATAEAVFPVPSWSER
jgi:branched-chain amino acid transport system substrate-binding protein